MSSLSRITLKTSFAAALLASFITPASATLIVTAGPGGGGDNVLSVAGCGPTGGPATTVMGCLNSNNATDVIFQSTSNSVQENLDFAAGGQAKLVAAGGSPLIKSQEWGFNNVTISLGGGLVFSQIIMNIEVFDATNINFFSNFGETSGPFALSGNGNGDFTVSSDLGDLSWLRIESGDRQVSYKIGHGPDAVTAYVTDGDINDVKQVRFNGVKAPCTANCGPPPAIPEPATLFLMGSALLGYGASRRKKLA
jgi:hypothetical protein